MALPPLAPLPPAKVRLNLGPEEWEACLDAWLVLADLNLRQTSSILQQSISHGGSLQSFVCSFYHELACIQPGDDTLASTKALSLKKICFKLTGRMLDESDSASQTLLSWDLLSDFSHAHLKSAALRRFMDGLWQRKSKYLLPILQKQKDSLCKALDSTDVEQCRESLSRLAPVMHASPDIAAFFMTGSDFLDSLLDNYRLSTSDAQKKAITTTLFLGLVSCVKTETPNTSLLSDHLYTLKAQVDKVGSPQSALPDLVTNTPLISRLRASISGQMQDRLSKLLDTLSSYRTTSLARPKKHVGKPRNKGKNRLNNPDAALHVHRMSLVTQVQDLFPDFGSAFVLKLLDEYGDDVEQVIAHVLEDSLPPYLASSDRTEQAPIYDTDPQVEIDHLVPKHNPTPQTSIVPERRNVFDDDDFDRLEFDASRLHIGKQNRDADPGAQPNKAAILSALAAFDSDDDERDDTYDVDDVGGTVDSAHPDGEPGPTAKIQADENETTLFNAYRTSPELFGRTFDVRKGQARQALKAETGMTDEAIEGWAIMLQRDPKRLKRLEAQLGAFDGRQTALPSTSYREEPGNTEGEDSEAAQESRGGFRGRGRGRGGRGRGGGRGAGNVAGPSNDPNTAQAQRRKESNKSSRANHNRRDQRARKMARGGFPG